MQCPNCKKELVEINGRYICSDCGKEVPASEVNVGSWGEDKTAPAEVAAPGAEAITDYAAGSGENEDYIADGSGQPPEPVVSEVVPAEPAAEPDISELSMSESAEPANDSFKDMAVPGTAEEPVIEAVPPVDSSASDNIIVPEAPIADDLAPEVPSVPEIANEPTIEPEPVTPAEVEVPPLPVPIPTPIPSSNEAMVADPLYNLPQNQAANTMPNPQDFYQPVPPAVPAEGAPTPEPVKEALPMDPNIYRDPMYDNQDPEAPVGNQQNPDKFVPPAKNRMNLYIIIGGVALAVLFLAGGVTAYFMLTSKAKVEPTPIVTPAAVTDCDTLASAVDKASCVSDNFTACSAATWTTTTKSADSKSINEAKNEILGTDEGGCSVSITYTKNTNTNLQDQSMTCSLDNTLGYTAALAKGSATTCSGSLADQLFPPVPVTPAD